MPPRLVPKASNAFAGTTKVKKQTTKRAVSTTAASNVGDADDTKTEEECQTKKLSATEHRRQRLSAIERKVLLKLAFEALDPEYLGKITTAKLNDVRDELTYLIRFCPTEEQRERQRFMVTHGEHTLEDIEKDERKAYMQSIDLESASDNEEQDDSDLADFIVSDTEIEAELARTQRLLLTFTSLPDKKRLKKQIDVEEEHYSDLD
jgi:hypothetical protein